MRWKVDEIDPGLRERAERATESEGLTPGAWVERTVDAAGEQDRRGAPPGTDAEAEDVLAAIEALEMRLEQRTARLERITDLAAPGGNSDDGRAPPTARPSAAAPATEELSPSAAPRGVAGPGGNVAPDEAGAWDVPGFAEPIADRVEEEDAREIAPGSPAEPRNAEVAGVAARRRRRFGRLVVAGAVLAVLGPLAILLRLGLEPPPAPGQPGTELAAGARENAGGEPGTDAGKATGDGDAATGAPTPDKPDAAIPPQLLARAEAGDAAAQFALGEMMYAGRHGASDRKRAIAWIEAAATKGHAEAQFRLAGLIARGIGFKRNPKEALFWYLSAAESGHTEAQFTLAELYAAGRGTDKNASEAARWYRAAAEKGHAEAAYRLGRMFEHGTGVEADRSEALQWYARAKAQGSDAATEKVAQLAARPASTAPAPEPPITRDPPPPGKRLGRAELRELQYLLKALAFDPGAVDGRLGRKTREAIRLYQRFAGLPETGAPDLALLRDLRAVARASGSTR